MARFNNISYIVSTAAGGPAYVIRATKSSWPAEKVECEVACIRLMAAKTALPVPTVLCYSASAAECAIPDPGGVTVLNSIALAPPGSNPTASRCGCRWILMEKMPGRVLTEAQFEALPLAGRQRLAAQMVSHCPGNACDLLQSPSPKLPGVPRRKRTVE